MKLRQSDPDHAPANFNPVARPYRWMEYLTFGRSLERCRTHFLPQFANRRSALVLGDGDGRFLARLLAANPSLHADAVDTSANMLHLLTHRAQAVSPHIQTCLRTHQTSALTFTPDRTYDLIVTHFFIDCLTQTDLETLITRITPHLTPKALWLISDFHIPQTGPMKPLAQAYVRGLYIAFRLLTNLRVTALPDHATPLTRSGFTRIAQHHRLGGLLTTELWHLS